MQNEIGQIVTRLKNTATVPDSFNWETAELNSLGNADDTNHAQAVREGQYESEAESFLGAFEATLAVYIDQGVDTF
jgi:hypothetical protein